MSRLEPLNHVSKMVLQLLLDSGEDRLSSQTSGPRKADRKLLLEAVLVEIASHDAWAEATQALMMIPTSGQSN